VTGTGRRPRTLAGAHRGRLDLKRAHLLRQIRVSGDVFGLIRNLDSTGPLTDSLHAVATEWLDG
jgi:hypothetical protein